MLKYIDAIDRGRLIRDILNEYGDTGGTEEANNIYKMILNQPTADVVEVVRCKDCRWGKEVCGNIECFADTNAPPEYHSYEWFCPNGDTKEKEK